MGFFKSVLSTISKGLEKTRKVLLADVRSFLPGRTVDEALLKQLEVALLKADMGVAVTTRLIASIRKDALEGKISRGEQVLDHLKADLRALWPAEHRELHFAPAGSTTVILVAGVNGAGKTTSVAKIAKALRDQGKSVLLAACDTYRAGAVRQLEIWSERLGVDVVKGAAGGDPAAVAFDACEAAIARKADVLLIDTAGRLHTQDPLMRQLTKIRDIAARKIPGAPHEVLLVLDAGQGQNALAQARQFHEAIGVTGLVITKLDGTAKGGIVLAIADQLGLPVRYIGVGESAEDFGTFDAATFVDAVLSPAAGQGRA